MIEIRKMKHTDCASVAQMHRKAIPTSFLSSLGQSFLHNLYNAILADKGSFGYVAHEDDQVVGFITFTENLDSLLKTAMKANPLINLWVLIRKIFDIRAVKRIFQNLLYPSKMKGMKLPGSELLSIAVSDSCRGQGVARKLMNEGLVECKRRGICQLKVLVGSELDAANALYMNFGFEKLYTIERHGSQSNIYVKQII